MCLGGGAWQRLEAGLVSLSFSRSQPSHGRIESTMQWPVIIWLSPGVEVKNQNSRRWFVVTTCIQETRKCGQWSAGVSGSTLWSSNKWWARRGGLGGIRCLLQSEVGQRISSSQASHCKVEWSIFCCSFSLGEIDVLVSLHQYLSIAREGGTSWTSVPTTYPITDLTESEVCDVE